ncbi:MAG: isoprenylcysteine carboxylmethyltransferase family protein, partial [Bacteroidales bacterium]|nr:isoprenylcysteine carboxylmethyltransferase family protein [Bacteroidales bacterium]
MLLNFTVFQVDAELLKERSKPGENTKQWDKNILGLSLLVTVSMYIIAGLDSGRYHWSPLFPPGLYICGFLFTVAGQLIFLIAQKQNRFFSSTVRIQTDRGHTVCETGLYRFVRHPAYMGSILQAVGFPLLFGSVWSILPVTLSVILFLVRTSLEDKTLIAELKGYKEYTQTTPYKIIPYLW